MTATLTSPTNTTATTPPTMTSTAMTSTAMTSTAMTGPATRTTGSKVRLRNVIHGEWIKFWSVRSTSLTLVASGVVAVVFGMIFSAVAESGAQAPGPAAFLTNPVDVALGGIGLTEMILGVLGVLVVASEYSTGLIRTSFAAAGRRSRVVGAKAAVVAGSVFTVALLAVVGAIAAGQAVYVGTEATSALTDVLDVILGTSVYLTGIALIGVALGFILRSTAGGIASLFGGVFIGPQLMQLLPDSITDVFLKYLPSEAGSAMMSSVQDPDLLSTGSAYAVFGSWVVGLLVVATFMVRRRDA